jgi:GNAT superfamily N-acetyltransferase
MGAGSSARELVVRIADPDELARLAELKTRVWEGESQDLWVERWPWQFRDHPWRPAQHASNFIVGEMGGRLVGGIGWMPTWLVADGKAHASAFACDGFVDPTLQRAGVGKAMFDAVLDECPWSIWMQTSVALTRYLEKNGFTRIAPANLLLLPLDPGRSLRSRGRTRLGALAGWVRGPVRALVRARARTIRTPAGVTLSEHSGFGDEFTRLDEALDSTGRVRPRRDAAYLRWRYLDCPFGSYQTRVARAGGELVGLVVYRANTTPSGRFGLVNQLDAHPRFPGVAEALLAAAVLDLVDRDVEAIKAFAPDATAHSRYRRLGFFESRRSPNVFVAPGTVETLGTTPDGARWCLSVGDCDLDYDAELTSSPDSAI